MQEKSGIKPVRGHSEGFRRKVVAQVRRRLAAGATLEAAGDEIGVEAKMLATWLSEERPSFVLVEVADGDDDAERTRLVVELACGVRVHGLMVAAVAELARRLSCSA